MTDHGNPINHSAYAVEQDLVFCILHVKNDIIDNILLVHKTTVEKNKNQDKQKQIWKLYFDGSSSREALGARIVLIYPSN